MAFLPGIVQGNLNRAAVHIVVTAIPALSLTASTMAKGQAHLSFEGDATTQIGTATGVVNSPEPYLMTTLVVSILRTQPVANAWLLQQQVNAVIGAVEAYPDSTSYSPIIMQNCSIQNVDPGPYDGTDPTVKITIKGQVQINSSMWASLTGVVAAIL
jgi:hypothetical protein